MQCIFHSYKPLPRTVCPLLHCILLPSLSIFCLSLFMFPWQRHFIVETVDCVLSFLSSSSIGEYVFLVLFQLQTLFNFVIAQDLEKRSPLHAAAYCGEGEIADLLIMSGARVNTKDNKWLTPLHRACNAKSDVRTAVFFFFQVLGRALIVKCFGSMACAWTHDSLAEAETVLYNNLKLLTLFGGLNGDWLVTLGAVAKASCECLRQGDCGWSM